MFSDYGSGSSGSPPFSSMHQERPCMPRARSALDSVSASYRDLLMGRCTLDDIMREFHMNGTDSPYNPEEDKVWSRLPGELAGMGPASPYLRQKSWPAPERSPPQRLPRPSSLHEPGWTHKEFIASTPVFDEAPADSFSSLDPQHEGITPEQTRVLNSLPDGVLYSLLRGLNHERRSKQPQECRFCKNNGERDSYVASHVLKDASGRVTCPVLRAFVCKRCGVSGDHAHTIKYCPLSTNEERIASMGVTRSMRMASGRRRQSLPASSTSAGDYLVYGATPPSVVRDCGAFITYGDMPLDPQWAALERKLMV